MRNYLVVIASLFLMTAVSAQSPDTQMVNKSAIQKDNMKVKAPVTPDKIAMNPELANWPESARTAAREMTGKYGKPDQVKDNELVWTNKGPWKKIRVTREETTHSFPTDHADVLEQTVYYRVPAEKYDELNAFDSNITVNMNASTITVRCDKEANNFLTLNLLNDIVLDKKTVAQARKSYVNILQEKKNGGNSTYLQKLMFTVDKTLGNSEVNSSDFSVKDMTEN